MNGASTSILLAMSLALSWQSVARAQEAADTAPAPLDVQQGEPEQTEAPGHTYTSPGWTERPRDLLRLVGAAVFIGLPWLLDSVLFSPLAGWSLDGGYEPEWEAFRYYGLVPVAGPWIQMAIKPNGLGSDGWVVNLTLNGLFQAVGFVLLIWDLVAPEYATNVYEHAGVERAAIGVSPSGLQIMGAF